MSGVEKTNCFGEERRTPGLITGCFGEGSVRKKHGRLFEKLFKMTIKDPNEIVERKPIGNITKVVFASGKIDFYMFDSQVGESKIPHIDGVNAEIAHDQRHKALASSALNKPRFNVRPSI